MEEFLSNYIVRITALSPIYIGSGESVGKKQYILNPKTHKVIIPDLEKMYQAISRQGKEKEYIAYMSDNRGYPLGSFLRDIGFSFKDYEKWKAYEMEGGEILSKKGKEVPKDISCFVKDPYGKPYIPGSSLKGLIRTALIMYEYKKNPEQFANIKEEIKRKSAEKARRNTFLNKEILDLEAEIFHTLNKNEKKNNAVNCNLSGLIVSDSKPVSTDDLILVQKIDKKVDGSTGSLPIMREAIRPGTVIEASITIDSKVCPYTVQDIMKALKEYRRICDEYFNKKFSLESEDEKIVWIGGGTGFVSKTIIYALFENEGLKVTDNIFKQTLSDTIYRKHLHDKDVRQYKIAPHTAKCTMYNGKIYDMGRAKIQFLRRTK